MGPFPFANVENKCALDQDEYHTSAWSSSDSTAQVVVLTFCISLCFDRLTSIFVVISSTKRSLLPPLPLKFACLVQAL